VEERKEMNGNKSDSWGRGKSQGKRKRRCDRMYFPITPTTLFLLVTML
jgi:hypothetical protein